MVHYHNSLVKRCHQVGIVCCFPKRSQIYKIARGQMNSSHHLLLHLPLINVLWRLKWRVSWSRKAKCKLRNRHFLATPHEGCFSSHDSNAHASVHWKNPRITRRVVFKLTVASNHVIAIAMAIATATATLHERLKNLAPVFQPLRIKR